MNLNKIFILGRLTRDPEKRNLPSGQPVVSFGMATNRFYTDKSGQKQERTEFHNIVAFGNLAETAGKYLFKGSLCLIEGRIQNRTWDDASGVKHYKTEIIAERLQLGPRSAGITSSPAIQEPSEQPAKEEIPIIEENELPTQTPETSSSETPKEETEEPPQEIDVKDIPL